MKVQPLKIKDLSAPIPVIQGGMGVGISLSSLAGNVAKNGGIGIISTAQIGYQEEDFLKDPIAANQKALKNHVNRAKELACGGIVGVNIMVATNKYEEYVNTAVKSGTDLIISGAGLPLQLPELVKGSTTKIAPIVSSRKAAATIIKLWDRKYKRLPDLLVIEGPMAGGHLGFSYEQLTDDFPMDYDEEIAGILTVVKDYENKYHMEIPVVMAGGIYDKKDMSRYMSMGLSGVQVATRFVTTHECDASDSYKNTYIQAKKEDIQIVKSPVGMPGRAINNEFIEKTKNGNMEIEKCCQCLKKCNKPDIPYCITKALVNAVNGNVEEGLLFCGSNAYRSQSIEYVSDIMKEFAQCEY